MPDRDRETVLLIFVSICSKYHSIDVPIKSRPANVGGFSGQSGDCPQTSHSLCTSYESTPDGSPPVRVAHVASL
jgi:hypothetical protein